jgi:hypothetical protein
MAITKLPRRVSIKLRNGKTKKGYVVKEVAEVEEGSSGIFKNLVQLIRWDNGKKEIRFAYYVKDKGKSDKHYQWASQTSLITSKKIICRLIRKAKNKGIL